MAKRRPGVKGKGKSKAKVNMNLKHFQTAFSRTLASDKGAGRIQRGVASELAARGARTSGG